MVDSTGAQGLFTVETDLQRRRLVETDQPSAGVFLLLLASRRSGIAVGMHKQ